MLPKLPAINPKDFLGDTWSVIQANWLSILIWSGVALALIVAVWWYRTYMSKGAKRSFFLSLPKFPKLPKLPALSFPKLPKLPFLRRANRSPALPPFKADLKPISDSNVVKLQSAGVDACLVVRNVNTGGLSYWPYLGYTADLKKSPHLADVVAFQKDFRFGKDRPLLLTFDKQFALSALPNKNVVLKPIAQVSIADSWIPENIAIGARKLSVTQWKSPYGYLRTSGKESDPVIVGNLNL